MISSSWRNSNRLQAARSLGRRVATWRNCLVAVICAAAVAAPQETRAQGGVAPVVFDCTCEDIVGSALGYQVREQLRRSAGLRLVANEKDAVIRLVIVTTENQQAASTAAAVSMMWLFPGKNPGMMIPYYIRTSVHVIGIDRTRSAAESIIGQLDEQAQSARR